MWHSNSFSEIFIIGTDIRRARIDPSDQLLHQKVACVKRFLISRIAILYVFAANNGTMIVTRE